ncbi:MAG: ribosome biogenesis GTPase Der [Chloroflexi bacterium]|nr:ribosome biogenesis GTPase Der [Chloroflexota bacterium]
MVAIVGRPNVGKSSLFNAVLRRRDAIVSEVSGTTRDRVTGTVDWMDRRMLLVDTGGLVPEPDTEIEAHIASQVDAALADADIVVLVVDATQGVAYADQAVAEHLRRAGKPVVVAVNKVDTQRQEPLVPEFYELGLGDPIPISAYHRHGIDDLLDAVSALLPAQGELPEASSQVPHFAIVGRPNVGKSSLANAILGEERSIVSEVPGTTRDAIDSPFEFEGLPAVLTDTAGIRRRGAVTPGIERYSVLRAVRAVERSDIAILVLDATEPATAQDLHIAGQVMESFKGVVVVVNKADLVKSDEYELTGRDARRAVLGRLHFMDYVPVVVTTATEGLGTDTLLRAAFEVHEQRQRWVDPVRLTRVVMDAVSRHLPPKQGRRVLKIYRVKQESVGPPTFVFYCNNPGLMHFSYERYLENAIRAEFGFTGTHLRLEFRGKGKLHVIGDHRTGGASARRPSVPRSPARKKT